MESVYAQMVGTAKLPVLNPSEFKLWKMRIEQYFLMIDYALWERTIDGVEQTYPPTTKEEKLARKNELKARDTLLMALLNEHQLKFNSYKNAKLLMEVIEKRFGEWKTHTLIWRNKHDLEALSMDDLYNNLKIYEIEVKGHQAQAKTHKMWLLYLPAALAVPIKLMIDVIDLEEMDLKWQMAMLTMRARRFQKKTGRKNRNREPVRSNVIVETTDAKALVAQDGIRYAWNDQAEDGPTNFTLMAYTSSGSLSSSSSDSKVSTCSKACLKSYEMLKDYYDNLSKDYKKSQLNAGAYKTGLESVEARLVVYKKNKDIFKENIKILKLDIHLRDNALTKLRNKLKKAEKERDEIKITLEKFENSSKTLNKMLDSQVNDKNKIDVGYHAVPLLYTGNFMPPKPNLILADVDKYVVSESVTSVPAVATNEAKT
nr:hypothetical protein [Tanacetum cinerariifolium]